MRVYARGLTALDHANIKHTSEMIQDGTIREEDLNTSLLSPYQLNRVKLPSPSTSDYISPSAASASSSTRASSEAYEVYDIGVTNKANIYDLDDDTYASYSIAPDTPETELMRWDFGSAEERWIYYRMSPTGSTLVHSRLYYSSDGSTWTKFVDISGGTPAGPATFTGAFRYIKWTASSASGSTFSVKLNSLDVAESFKYTIDDDTTTKWRPSPANEAGAWIQWDTGAAIILCGCRIYWGTDTNYLPSAYRIQVSEDGSTWEDVVTETSPPPAGAWMEYSWRARYGRYIRLIVDTHGPSGTEIYEMDYYSRLVDRVAAEHGHGSGVTPHLKGHGVKPFESLRKRRDLDSLIKRIEILENLVG